MTGRGAVMENVAEVVVVWHRSVIVQVTKRVPPAHRSDIVSVELLSEMTGSQPPAMLPSMTAL